ncbi:MAG: glycoside hydrolase family 2 TIM barrel-domain containing protein [Eubacteriales bacterium]|nr:glycoside hydrolase family 2 TIM barrel-domain containing protein [Eubacteriales bacterium]
MKKYRFNEGWMCRKAEGNFHAVTIPHDAMIKEQRSADAPGGSAQGFFPGGRYIYEKTFLLPEEWVGQPFVLQFEGVHKNAKVYVNGVLVGGAVYGYIPFRVNCGILPEGKNVIRVECNTEKQPDSRWYTGSGIYRPVWAWVGPGITEEDVRITTLSINPAVIHVSAAGQDAEAEIWDDHRMLARGKGTITIPEAKLWSDETPHLYICKVQDQEIKFGVRQLSWSNKGLFVNGKNTLLRGGCVHHDSGILGAATYDESEWRRVRILKEAGYNAIRSAHNPCSRAMLEACDYYGMYLMDETWDVWYNPKNRYDYASLFEQNWERDVEAMVQRDYNHPSVILYSIANEVAEPASSKGVNLAKRICDKMHSLDPYRPVTGGFNLMIIHRSAKGNAIYDENGAGRKTDGNADKANGMNSLMFNILTSVVGTGMNKAANSDKADRITSPVLNVLDIAGYNYASGRYPLEGSKHPERIIFGSETFPQDLYKNWEMVKKYPYLIGDFMWTSWDYIGEAGGGAWAYTSDGKGFEKPFPWILADMGAFDILGNPGGELFWTQAVWGMLDNPVICVQPVNHPGIRPAKSTWRGTNAIPSWSWKGCEGNKAVVEVYFDCAKIELLKNGKSLGRKKVKECRAVFKTKYAPGKLEAIAYDETGNRIGRSELETCRKEDVHICPEVQTAKKEQIIFVPIEIGDGIQVESNADRKVQVKVENGELLAFGSANPRTVEQYHTGSFTTYYGKALAVVRADEPGTLLVKAGDTEKEIRITD